MSFWSRTVRLIQAEGVDGFLIAIRDYIISQAQLLYEAVVLTVGTGEIIRSFESKAENINGVIQSVDFSLSFNYLGISVNPVQQRQEITELLELLERHEVKRLLEIGTDRGGTLFLFSRVASEDAKIVSMNMPWSTLNAYCMKYRNQVYEKFAHDRQTIDLLVLNSHEKESVAKVKELVGGRLDFLFIDGDHSYNGVKMDFEMYSPLVKKGGIIAFHDIAENRGQKSASVKEYWNEIKKGHEHKELEYSGGKGYGIGIIFWEGRTHA